MEGIGEVQRWALFFSGLIWGILAILISLTFFYCEYFPQKCENFKSWLREKFNRNRK